MKINLKSGVGELLFGMKQKDVTELYGNPDKTFKDEEENVVYLYNALKLRLTFYIEEDLRLGYIIASDSKLDLFGFSVIGRKLEEIKSDLAAKQITKFSKEEFDTYENYLNEENWFILQVEFNEVVKVEVGAIFDSNDEFDWKFKG